MSACEHGSSPERPSYEQLASSNESLRLRLAAAETDLHALRSGRVGPDVASSLDQSGSPSHCLAARARNVAEPVLRESMELYRSLFTNMLNGFALCQMHYVEGRPADFTYLEVNAAFESLTGLKDVVGKRASDVIPGIREADPDLLEIYGRVARTGKPEQFETYVRSLDMWFATLVYSPRNEHFVTVFDVITERKQAEEALQCRNEEILRFTSAVSHDLKSPLVTIRTFLGYLENDLKQADAARVETDLGHIRRAAEKMTYLLDDLLSLSRIGRKVNRPEDMTLQAIVREALEMVAGQIAERQVQIQVSDAPVVLHGDRMRLSEVFQNLVDNAIKFMGEQAEPRIEIGVEAGGPEIVLFVRDNGLGIDPRHQSKLFGIFEKLHPGTKGTGMGLAVVKRIIEVHGGRIWVESAGVGQGSTFRFTLSRLKRI
jgi:signal transduction histidine kinase